MSKLLSEIQNPFNNCAHKSNCAKRIDELEKSLFDIREVWAESDISMIEYSSRREKQVVRIANQCYEIATEALKK